MVYEDLVHTTWVRVCIHVSMRLDLGPENNGQKTTATSL